MYEQCMIATRPPSILWHLREAAGDPYDLEYRKEEGGWRNYSGFYLKTFNTWGHICRVQSFFMIILRKIGDGKRKLDFST